MWLLLSTILCIGTLAISSNAVQSSNYTHYRLPTTIQPNAYTIKIITYLNDTEKEHDEDEFSFHGLVTIRFKVIEDTQNITLHSKNLVINELKTQLINVQPKQGKICINSTEENIQLDYYIMQLCQPIKKDEEYSLSLSFEAPLNNALNGYYKSSYINKETNQTHWLSITQFEPASARAAFPCFDEPAYKAKFKIILGHHEDFQALSNMHVKVIEKMKNYPDWVWTEFEESPPMSTYIVGYTVNDFYYTESNVTLKKNHVLFRTWSRPGAIEQCDFAAIAGPKLLEFYEEMFRLDFPLQKIDLIAVPDFIEVAMENWGLITFQEDQLLYTNPSVLQKKSIVKNIAHELSHQWFGNLVTMDWWSDLWLNEGFATYMSSLAMVHVIPDSQSVLEESLKFVLSTSETDALTTSRSIWQPVDSVDKTIQIFNKITYLKGAKILSMIHIFLGDEAFRSGIQAYLEKYAYKNVNQDNLWAALTVEALEQRSIPEKYDIKRIMDSWTLQTGYPLVTVKRDYDKNTVTITQERYLLDTEASRSKDHNCWWVPLSFTTKSETNFSTAPTEHWLECDDSSNKTVAKTIDLTSNTSEWIIFNLQMSGLYKVNYDERNWNFLIETLMSDDFNKIHLINRAQLINDAFSLAWSGDQDYDIAIRLLEYLEREREFLPWYTALSNLDEVSIILSYTSGYEPLKKYIRKLITPIYLNMSASNMTLEHKLLIDLWACNFEIEDSVERAQEYFLLWQQTPEPDKVNPVETDFRAMVYCYAIRYGGENEWQFLWNRYKNSSVAAEKIKMLKGLGCSREIWILQQLLEWTFDESSGIRKQDSVIVFIAIAVNDIGCHLANEYVISNFQSISNYYSGTPYLLNIFMGLAYGINNERDYNDLKTFIEQNKSQLVAIDEGVQQVLENVKLRFQWKERNYKKFTQILKSRLE